MKHKWLTFYGGTEFSRKFNGFVQVVMLGHGEDEATNRYYECVARHPDLTALKDPMVAEGGV